MINVGTDFNTEFVNEFNAVLKEKGSVIRLWPRGYVVDIKLHEDSYLNMEDQIINPTKQFYEDLEEFFKGKDINITYNNMGSCFWEI